MSSRLTASALLGLGLVVMTAIAQPPASNSKPADKKPAEKKADPLDGLIGAALVNDPDVKVAHAKLQLADAELAKARQAVTQKVISLNAAITDQKRAVGNAEQLFKIKEMHYKKGAGSFEEYAAARDKYETAKSKLAQLETELKLITGGGMKVTAGWDDLSSVHRGATWNASCVACHTTPLGKGATDPAAGLALDWFTKRMAAGGSVEATRAQAAASLLALAGREPVKGPVADRIRAALDKPVKLGAKGEEVSFEKAREVFKKDAGLDVPVRISNSVLGSLTTVRSEGEELPVGAWLQLFQDFNGGVIYVRDYGLLFTEPKAAPPDAITLTQLWKQKPAAKEQPKTAEEQPKK